MRYQAPPSTFFARNRQAFARRMAPQTLAVFHSNDRVTANADATYPFTQDSNMYYLSGIDQEQCMLVIFPDAPKPAWKEVLFIRKTDPLIQVWEGWKYSKEEARAASGVQTVMYYEEFDQMITRLAAHVQEIYVDLNEHSRQHTRDGGPTNRTIQYFRSRFPLHPLLRAWPIVEELRVIKAEEELTQIRKACEITGKAFHRVLRTLQPGMMEYEVEAEIAYEFLRNGATGPAYETIVASGKHACILHYTQNDQPCKDGDLVLMDFGAEYAHYSADLTRTIPVNGRYTPRQKEVYLAVLRVMQQAKALLQPGTLLDEYQQAVGSIMEKELVDLGLLTPKEVREQDKEAPAYRKYFMHGTSHFLGLDTHDVGNRYEPLQAGMVLTCEPGIYIPEEQLGVRIENDILLTHNGPVDLMADIPIEPDEIEALMHQA